MSFLVDDHQRVYLLDQVNQRVQIFEPGKPVHLVPLPGDSYQDLRLDGDGNLVLLDRLVRRAVDVVDLRGQTLRTFPLDGGGGTTGLFVRDDGIWVEYQHRQLVRVQDGDSMPGRFSADGRRLYQTGRQGRYLAEITFRPSDRPGAKPRSFARVRFEQPVFRLAELAFDRQNRVLLAAQMESRLEVIVLDADGAESQRYSLPVPDESLEQFRQLHLTADGNLYQLRMNQRGVSVRRVLP